MLSANNGFLDEDRRRNSDELFLNELKLQFENLLRLKEGLESRANNLVVVSATIVTLLFGFAAFSYTNIKPDNVYFWWIPVPLGISIGASITAMVFGLYASRLTTYDLPFGYTRFYNTDGLKNTEMVNAYRDSTEIMFFNTMISAYLKSLRTNALHYEDRTERMMWAQRFFLVSLSAVPFLLLFVLLAISSISLSSDTMMVASFNH